MCKWDRDAWGVASHVGVDDGCGKWVKEGTVSVDDEAVLCAGDADVECAETVGIDIAKVSKE